MESTVDVTAASANGRRQARPGVLLVYAAAEPTLRAASADERPVDVGRDPDCALQVADASLSRRHAQVTWRDGTWVIEDLGSRNGTFVDGVRITGAVERAGAPVIRAGLTVMVCSADLGPYGDARIVVRDGLVIGPSLAAVLRQVEQAAAFGQHIHLAGESGVGKEVAARAFHDATGGRGPFVAVNCAAVPAGLAERLLFGVRRGAFSGADADAEGYLQAADGGTLFLDELGELELAVQAKLLRVLQTSEVLPLGGTRPRRVAFRLCTATLHSLRAQVARGLFREDLYYRLGKPEVVVPPLRARREELPWLVAQETARVQVGLRPNALFVEAALLRPWPGNVRELLAETQAAARAAAVAGGRWVDAAHLHPEAGRAIHGAADPTAGDPADPDGDPAADAAPPDATPAPVADLAPADRPAQIAAALRLEEGSVARAARRLGVHRTQLRRWLVRYAIDPRTFAPPGARPRR